MSTRARPCARTRQPARVRVPVRAASLRCAERMGRGTASARTTSASRRRRPGRRALTLRCRPRPAWSLVSPGRCAGVFGLGQDGSLRSPSARVPGTTPAPRRRSRLHHAGSRPLAAGAGEHTHSKARESPRPGRRILPRRRPGGDQALGMPVALRVVGQDGACGRAVGQHDSPRTTPRKQAARPRAATTPSGGSASGRAPRVCVCASVGDDHREHRVAPARIGMPGGQRPR